MANSPEPQAEPKPRVEIEYEDPHYHDEDDVAPVVDDMPHAAHSPAGKKPERRLPPPRRRFTDD